MSFFVDLSQTEVGRAALLDAPVLSGVRHTSLSFGEGHIEMIFD
jgi:hypothetical protein